MTWEMWSRPLLGQPLGLPPFMNLSLPQLPSTNFFLFFCWWRRLGPVASPLPVPLLPLPIQLFMIWQGSEYRARCSPITHHALLDLSHPRRCILLVLACRSRGGASPRGYVRIYSFVRAFAVPLLLNGFCQDVAFTTTPFLVGWFPPIRGFPTRTSGYYIHYLVICYFYAILPICLSIHSATHRQRDAGQFGRS